VDALGTTPPRFPLQLGQHPVTVWLCIGRLSCIHIGRARAHHALDSPCTLLRRRRPRLRCAQPRSQPTIRGPQGAVTLDEALGRQPSGAGRPIGRGLAPQARPCPPRPLGARPPPQPGSTLCARRPARPGAPALPAHLQGRARLAPSHRRQGTPGPRVARLVAGKAGSLPRARAPLAGRRRRRRCDCHGGHQRLATRVQLRRTRRPLRLPTLLLRQGLRPRQALRRPPVPVPGLRARGRSRLATPRAVAGQTLGSARACTEGTEQLQPCLPVHRADHRRPCARHRRQGCLPLLDRARGQGHAPTAWPQGAPPHPALVRGTPGATPAASGVQCWPPLPVRTVRLAPWAWADVLGLAAPDVPARLGEPCAKGPPGDAGRLQPPGRNLPRSQPRGQGVESRRQRPQARHRWRSARRGHGPPRAGGPAIQPGGRERHRLSRRCVRLPGAPLPGWPLPGPPGGPGHRDLLPHHEPLRQRVRGANARQASKREPTPEAWGTPAVVAAPVTRLAHGHQAPLFSRPLTTRCL
jgi:hypothetical protein